MRIARYLMRRHRWIFGIYWGIMLLVLAGLIASLEVFGPWIVETDRASTWSLVANAAPGWFVFVIGIMLASTYLPVFIAHGITRRDYTIGAGLFALGTAVMFAGLKVLGLLVEALAYNMFGIMDELGGPYPWPTVGGTLIDLLSYLGFMCSGWLISLLYYRMKVWWALPLTPLAAIPLSSGMELNYELHWSIELAIVAVAVVVAYLAAQGLALKPRKA